MTIEIKSLTFGYSRRRPNVFEDFGLNISGSGVYGLLGRNGTGKSTLLYLMSGLLAPKSGQVCIDGTDVWKHRPSELADLYIVPEEFDLPEVELDTYVQLNAPFYPRFSEKDLHTYLQLFELEDFTNLKALSMGQKKKVLICFALATHTPLLLMDEPTNGLDIPAKAQFRKLIAAGMEEGKTIIISTHQVRDIEHLLDQVVIIDGSRVVLDEPVPRLTEAFCFKETDDAEEAKEALTVLPSLHGNLVMLPNETNEESVLNLELLFDAALTHPERMAAHLLTSKND